MKTHHVCFEGTLACSGCNMCPSCFDVVNREVLASAMRRTTEAITNARGADGVVAVRELDTKNFWAVFYGFYGEAWRLLHAAMMNDPKVTERAYDLRSIPGFVETGRYVPPPLAPMQPAFAAIPPGYAPMPIPSVVPAVAPIASPPAAVPVVPLSAIAMPMTTPLESYADAPSAAMTFTLREEANPAPSNGAAHAFQKMHETVQEVMRIDDVPAESKLVAGPADIRHEITADDIAASATVLETPLPSNGIATHE